ADRGRVADILQELHRHGARHRHERADREVDARGGDHQRHPDRDHHDGSRLAQDVDQVADEVAVVRVDRDGEITGVLQNVQDEQRDDRDDAPEERLADQLAPEGWFGGGVHRAPCSAVMSVPAVGSAAGTVSVAAVVSEMVSGSAPSASSSVSAAAPEPCAAMTSTISCAVTSGPFWISPILRWSFSTTIRSERRTTSSSSEETKMTATPVSASCATASWISALAPTSMPRVGSSRMSSSGSVASQRPSSTFCWFPPERFLIIRFGSDGRTLSSEMYFSTMASCSLRGMGLAHPRSACTARMMFSRTVRSPTMPSSRRFSVEKAMRLASPSAGDLISVVRPFSEIDPSSGRSAP